MLILGFIIFSTGYYFVRTYTTSEGTRTGTLIKISKKGKLFKTYEGDLVLAGSQMLTKQSIWNFSVLNENVYSNMQPLEGKMVRLYYKEVVNAFPWQGETNYLVYKTEAVKTDIE